MNTSLATRPSQEPPSVTRARFETLLAKNGLDYGITWKWVGRCRHGIIEVYDASLGPADGVMDSAEFKRNTHRWTDNDCRIGRMRTNSPKHNAVKALVARMRALSA